MSNHETIVGILTELQNVAAKISRLDGENEQYAAEVERLKAENDKWVKERTKIKEFLDDVEKRIATETDSLRQDFSAKDAEIAALVKALDEATTTDSTTKSVQRDGTKSIVTIVGVRDYSRLKPDSRALCERVFKEGR